MDIIKPPYWEILNKGHSLARGFTGRWFMNERTGEMLSDLSGRSGLSIPIAMNNYKQMGAA